MKKIVRPVREGGTINDITTKYNISKEIILFDVGVLNSKKNVDRPSDMTI